MATRRAMPRVHRLCRWGHGGALLCRVSECVNSVNPFAYNPAQITCRRAARNGCRIRAPWMLEW